MLTWNKTNIGEYVSADGRFVIKRTFGLDLVMHWELHDKTRPYLEYGPYVGKSLMECIIMANNIASGTFY